MHTHVMRMNVWLPVILKGVCHDETMCLSRGPTRSQSGIIQRDQGHLRACNICETEARGELLSVSPTLACTDPV